MLKFMAATVLMVVITGRNCAEVDRLGNLVVGDDMALYADTAQPGSYTKALLTRTRNANRTNKDPLARGL